MDFPRAICCLVCPARARFHRLMLRLARENVILRRKRIAHSDYLFRSATHWRMRAEAIRTLVEDAQNSKVRTTMLRIAANYERLAGHADDRAAQEFDYVSIGEPDDETAPAPGIG